MLEIPQGSEVSQENIYCVSIIPHTVLLGFFPVENEIISIELNCQDLRNKQTKKPQTKFT